MNPIDHVTIHNQILETTINALITKLQETQISKQELLADLDDLSNIVESQKRALQTKDEFLLPARPKTAVTELERSDSSKENRGSSVKDEAKALKKNLKELQEQSIADKKLLMSSNMALYQVVQQLRIDNKDLNSAVYHSGSQVKKLQQNNEILALRYAACEDKYLKLHGPTDDLPKKTVPEQSNLVH